MKSQTGSPGPAILIIAKQTAGAAALAGVLAAHGYRIRRAASVQAAEKAAAKSPPDLIVLHMESPDADGYESCRRLKAATATARIPVLLVAAAGAAFDPDSALAAGAADYVPGPLHEQELLARVETHLALTALKEQLAARDAQLGRQAALKRIEVEALRASERQHRRLLDTLHEGVWVVDATAHTTLVNPQMAHMLGYTVDEMQGTHISEYMDERGLEIALRELGCRAMGTCGQLEFEFRRRDGSPLYTLLEASPIMDDDGRYQGAIAGIWDIGQRRRAEQALRQAHEKLEERVEERTAELVVANEQLRAEIDKRRQIEEELRLSKVALEQRVAERTRELSALLDVSNALALMPDLASMLNSILDRLQGVVGYDSATVLEVETASLRVAAHRGLDGQGATLSVGSTIAQSPIAREVMAGRRAVIIPDAQDDPLLPPAFRETSHRVPVSASAPIRSWMGVPLVVQDRTIGLLSLWHSRPHHFTSSQAELALTIATQVAVAMQNARLYAEAQALAAIEERQHLARELHDSVTQTLFSAGLVAELLPQIWRRDPDEAMDALEELRRLTSGALIEMRAMLLELRPAALGEARLDELVTQLAEAITGRTGLIVGLELAPMPMLPHDVQVTFYRVCQEALHNAVKHAAAAEVTVRLSASPPVPIDGLGSWDGRLTLQIVDDGRGFDPDHTPPDRLGLRIMHERAQSIGARLTVASRPGMGTRVALAWRGAGRQPPQHGPTSS